MRIRPSAQKHPSAGATILRGWQNCGELRRWCARRSLFNKFNKAGKDKAYKPSLEISPAPDTCGIGCCICPGTLGMACWLAWLADLGCLDPACGKPACTPSTDAETCSIGVEMQRGLRIGRWYGLPWNQLLRYWLWNHLRVTFHDKTWTVDQATMNTRLLQCCSEWTHLDVAWHWWRKLPLNTGQSLQGGSVERHLSAK